MVSVVRRLFHSKLQFPNHRRRAQCVEERRDEVTAHELQRIASRLSNQCWCRHWLNYGDRRTGVIMAIQCVDILDSGRFTPARVNGIEELGFTLADDERLLYTIPRTNEDGTPYVSKLF